MLKNIAIVPIRHFSQRVAGKNYRQLGNKLLYQYILDSLLQTEVVEKIFIDTNSPIIKAGVKQIYQNEIIAGRIQIFDRHPYLCEHDVSMNEIIKSVLARIYDQIDHSTLIMQSHVTNPLLSWQTIEQAFKVFRQLQSDPEQQYDSLMSINQFKKRLWKKDEASNTVKAINHNSHELIQTQDLTPLCLENSCLYLFTSECIYTFGTRLGEQIAVLDIPEIESHDIDTEDDFILVQQLLQTRLKNNLSINKNVEIENPRLLNNPVNEKLLNYFQTELCLEIEQFKNQNIDNKKNQITCILISAPYMMPDIATFQEFYDNLGIRTIIAEVEERLSEDDLLKYQGQYDIAISGDDAFTRKVLSTDGPRALCKWGTGIDSFDQIAAKELNIAIYNTPDAFSVPVAQSIMSAILSFLRTTHNSTQMMQHSDKWIKLPSKTIEECTFGIIGVGNVGTQTAKYLRSFGGRVLAYDNDPVVQNNLSKKIEGVIPTELAQLLQEADFICTCSTLNPTSHHIINQESIKLIKRGAYLINMARGPLVEEIAATQALQSGQLAGMALDVFEVEPLPINSLYRYLPNVLLSSHNSNSSPKYWNKVHINTLRNSLKFLLK